VQKELDQLPVKVTQLRHTSDLTIDKLTKVMAQQQPTTGPVTPPVTTYTGTMTAPYWGREKEVKRTKKTEWLRVFFGSSAG
jgi:hypothetical protein